MLKWSLLIYIFKYNIQKGRSGFIPIFYFISDFCLPIIKNVKYQI